MRLRTQQKQEIRQLPSNKGRKVYLKISGGHNPHLLNSQSNQYGSLGGSQTQAAPAYDPHTTLVDIIMQRMREDKRNKQRTVQPPNGILDTLI